MKHGKKLARLLPWAVAIVLPVILLTHLNTRLLWETLQHSEWQWAILAASLNLLVITSAKIMRFRVLIGNLPYLIRPATLKDAASVVTASRTLNLVLPARAGETLRAVQLHRRCGYPVESVIAAIAMESVLEITALAVPAFIYLFAGFALGGKEKFLYPLAVAGAACLFIAFLIGGKNGEAGLALTTEPTPHGSRLAAIRHKVLLFARKLHESAKLLNGPKVWARALSWTWISDFTDVMMIGLCLRAIGVQLDPLSWFLVLAAINVAIAVPAPGHLGTLEAGAVLILGALGVDQSKALAFALVYHSAHLIPVILVGGFTLHSEFNGEMPKVTPDRRTGVPGKYSRPSHRPGKTAEAVFSRPPGVESARARR